MQPVSTIARGGIDVPESARGATAVVPKSWGWPTKVVGTSVLLETISGFCGVEMRQRHGDPVLRLLCQAGTEGPVVRVMRPDPWLVFLAEADTVVEAEFLARHSASLVHQGRTVPLPPTDTGAGRVSWVVAPRPNHRWLPELSTIVWALRTARSRG
jgi:hypothetical protein